MNNMRRGFTMIELIFVIVIIGILAAVAIPKLAGTAEEARKSIYTSFMGTLNRSVGPAMWADKVATGGSVKTITKEVLLANYTELPKGVVINATLANCAIPGETPGIIGTVTTEGLPVAEDIYCIDGSSTSAPRFGYGILDSNETNTSLQNNL